jgi:hypothetical protein
MEILTGSTDMRHAHEQRLQVVPGPVHGIKDIFFPRSFGDRKERNLYVCGSCSIVFAGITSPAIRSGAVGSCGNCGAVNRL